MIHKTAIIDPSAKLADDVEIGPYTIIEANVEIDSGTWVGPHVVIKGPSRIGKDNKIYQFASIGEVTQSLGDQGEGTSLEIGDRNTIREYATINRGALSGSGTTKIGNDNLLMAYTHVAHDCILGDHIIFSNGATVAGHVEIDDYAILSGFVAVHQFTHIGAHSFIGMASAVNLDVPPYVLVSGNYASAISINKEGLKRRDFSADTIRALHKAFMVLIRSRQKTDAAMQEIAELAKEYKQVAELVEFIKKSERGVVKCR